MQPPVCPICLDPMQQPVALPCLHSFCEPCAKQLKPCKGKPNHTYRCPVCNATGIGYKPNYALREMLEGLPRKKKTTRWRCMPRAQPPPPRDSVVI